MSLRAFWPHGFTWDNFSNMVDSGFLRNLLNSVVVAAVTVANALFGWLVLKESLPPERRRKFEMWRANPLGALKALNRFPAIFGLIGVGVLLQLAHDALPSTWKR